jgi:hypothetical protein
MNPWLGALTAVVIALAAAFALASCVQVTISGDNSGAITIMQSTMGTFTIPLSGLPGTP